MSSSGTFEFPSPVGGIPLSIDFAPSIIFAILYAAVLPLFAYRMINKTSRTYVLIGCLFFCVERVVVFSFRAEESHDTQDGTSNFFLTYMQTTWGVGFITIAQDWIIVLRAFLVNSTKKSSEADVFDVSSQSDIERPLTADASELGYPTPSHRVGINEENSPETARERFLIRRILGFGSLALFATNIIDTVAGALYWNALKSAGAARSTQQLRYVGTGLAFFYIFLMFCAALWACFTNRVPRRPALYHAAVSALLIIIAVYRLVVMRFQTTSLLSTAPGSLNSDTSKTSFYILHVLPEWIATVMVQAVNVREWYSTGLKGDKNFWQSKDGKGSLLARLGLKRSG
ncbi:hypothetical protein CERSUDRAFT_136100 [Gelatoporia subvermispora B]|uniref:Uncharacterized protein n=1 Tax=Ceriporiopsis subvermispora (strain B) TaxID=914234 RepID=M2PMA1_CERS8|nr:hypothetical protein CERSUDRAFT_136100 [Gelatoporia subvermispora B]